MRIGDGFIFEFFVLRFRVQKSNGTIRLANPQGCNVSKEVLAEQQQEDEGRLVEEREKRLAAIDARTAAGNKKGMAHGPGKLSAQLKASSSATAPPPERVDWN
jgi:lactam utilization protein B